LRLKGGCTPSPRSPRLPLGRQQYMPPDRIGSRPDSVIHSSQADRLDSAGRPAANGWLIHPWRRYYVDGPNHSADCRFWQIIDVNYNAGK
jgi:hypothetical protein